jgi:hypothetical protein
MGACGGYSLALESIAAGWCGGMVGQWPGWESPRLSGATAACASAGVDGIDESVWLWTCGRDEPAIRSQVWAVLMMEGSKLASAGPGRSWPKGYLSALVAVALAELRPRDPRDGWTDQGRLRVAEEAGVVIDRASWSRLWKGRYGWILERGVERERRARRALCDGRLG